MKTLWNLGFTLLVLAGMLLPPARVSAAPGLSFNVTTSLDSVDASPGDGMCADSHGQCSLRAAIMEANLAIAPVVIILPAATYVLTITGSGEIQAATGDLDIYNTLTLTGAGAAGTIIDATSLHDRVFHAHPGAHVTFSGVTIQNGANPDTIGLGGGILSEGTFTLTASTVSGNSAAFGGGIVNNGGTFTMDQSTISSNHADNEGGGIVNLNTTSSAVFTLNDSTVSSNTVAGSGGAGIINLGIFTLNNATISGNNSAGAGGGIYSPSGAGVTLTVNTSQITSNHANFNGGGIAAAGPVTLNNSQVTGNTASVDGAGIYTFGALTLNNSQVSSNKATALGGGLYAGAGSLILNHIQANSNQAASGGGIYLDFTAGSSDKLTIEDSTLASNSASGSGGGLYASGGGADLARDTFNLNTATLDGGGMLVTNGSAVQMTNSTLSDNTAGRSGGGMEVSGGALNGYNLTIAGNAADSSKSGAGTGGGIDNSATVALKNSILALNVHQTAGLPVDDDCHGAFGLFSYSLVGMPGCTFTSDHTLTGFDPMLSPLANNGGPTLTRALQKGSPAIDAGNPAGCTDSAQALLPTDQRGFPRPIDGNGDGVKRCDIGAFEYGSLVFIPLVLH